jgi:hypothetical protein
MGCGASSEGGSVGSFDGGGLRLPLPGSWRIPGPGLSLADLQNRRVTFWDTRPAQGGHPQMWANLKLVCDALLTGDTELAGTILDSTGARAQRSDLVQLQTFHVYDATGVLYEMPRLVWSTPANILSNEEAAAAAQAASLSSSGGGGSRRRAPGTPATPIALRVRLAPSPSTCEQDIPLDATSATSVEELRRSLHELLLSGKHDMKPDVSIKKPNVWSARGGLPPARQRLMYRCVRWKGGGAGLSSTLAVHVRKCSARALLRSVPIPVRRFSALPRSPHCTQLPLSTAFFHPRGRRGKELRDGILTLGDCGIQDGDILQIFIKADL